MQTAQAKTVAKTVQNMINEIGLLRKVVEIDSMPVELQEARYLLRQLDEKLSRMVKE